MDKLEKVMKGLKCCKEDRSCVDCPYENGFDAGCINDLERDTLELLRKHMPQWTPITFRALTEEEKAEHPDWCYIIDSPTPEDGEDILVSDGKNVWADVWGNDGDKCYLESDHELEGVAWMKMPAPWRKEAKACETCRYDLGGGHNNCKINLEAECAAGGYEAWEAREAST